MNIDIGRSSEVLGLRIQVISIILFVLILFFTSCSLLWAATIKYSTASVERAFLAGQYDRAISHATMLIDERSSQRDELYYIRALSQLKLRRFYDARQDFETIISKYQRSKRAFDAYVGMGDAYFLEGNTTSAIRFYNEAIEKFPDDKNVSVARSRLDDCHRRGVFTPVVSVQASKDQPPSSNVGIKPKEQVAVAEYAPVNRDIARPETKNFMSVQTGCFKNRKNAERFSQKLAREGYESYVEASGPASNKLYRVKIGRSLSREEASAIASKLAKSGYSTKLCSE